ncbi:MAG: hypothetical protein L0Y80_12390 [Ignavibacteriae bacterium]|nr:hypothetical protein [Ignavibacteriota bacterium]
MELQQQVLLLTLDRLEKLEIPYYVTGSIAVSIYGKPRFTHDIDLVVAILPTSVNVAVKQFHPDFYISAEGLQDALERHSMANLIHHESGMKIDLWVLDRQNEYALSQFQRRLKKHVFGRDIYFISAEDLVLQKLSWHRETQADRDWNDVLGVWEFLHDSLDKNYLSHWANRLMLKQSFEKLIASHSLNKL